MRSDHRFTINVILATMAGLGLAACAGEGGDAAGAGGAGGAGAETAYVQRLGSDTLAVEVVRRHEGGIEGELLVRSPVTRHITYSAQVDETGRVTRFETDQTTPPENPEGPKHWHAAMAMDAAAATVIREVGDHVDTLEVALDGVTIPNTGNIPLPAGIIELALAQAGAGTGESSGGPGAGTGDGSFPFALLAPWGPTPRAAPNALTDRGAAEYALDFFGSPMIVSADADGHVAAISGAQTTMKIEVEPIARPDMAALASDFAARDANGTGIGTPSPPGTANASGGGASFEIQYSRPSVRGRTIWGGLVPYDEVWRTGANAATQFTTDRDVTIGDLEVPAGTYTLWSTYTPEGGTLIVNSQTGIWGTAYDGEYDFGRTALSREDLAQPVERFTISIDPNDSGGVLNLDWDTARYTVPIRVR